MSRVGSMPVVIPKGVKVDLCGDLISVSGPNGLVSILLNPGLVFSVVDGSVLIGVGASTAAMHGTCRSNVNNAIIGVSKGIVFNLSIVGVGYKAEVTDGFLIMYLGFSHDIRFKVPKGVSIVSPKQDRLVIEGCDIRKVSAVADVISRFRKYNPYKGKGVIINRARGGYLLRKEANKKK